MIKIKISILSIILLCSLAWSELYIKFPQGSGVVDVTDDPYNAKGDGKTDDTEAIQRALNDHPNGNHIIYLPEGTYLVSRQIEWPRGKESKDDYQRTILQGQHTSKTIIKLKDRAHGYDNPLAPRAVISTGLGPEPRLRNAIRNMTINTGKKNPGAIGIRFNASKQGTIRDVKIKSKDKKGVYGIDMGYTPNIGPVLLSGIEIEGFDVGIFTRFPNNGMTFEYITLKDQNKYGIENHDQILSIRKLKHVAKVPAIYNRGETAVITLIDARIESPRRKKWDDNKNTTAIDNHAKIFARNILVDGFFTSIKNNSDTLEDVKELAIQEYSTESKHKLCASPNKSLNLPIAETVPPPWGASRSWVNIAGDYGASGGDGTNDADAIQEAIDDGAEALIFDADGRYTINKDIYIRKNVSRVIGAEAKIDGPGKFIIEKGTPPTIIFERFSSLAGGIKHNSGRTLILRDLDIKEYHSSDMGSGDVYLENVTAGQLNFSLQNVWARQLSFTSDRKTKVINKSGIIWILGLTAYNTGTIIENLDRGEVEILGGHVISDGSAQVTPMFINNNSNMSLTNIRETATRNTYHTLVTETRGKEEVHLMKKDVLQFSKGSYIGQYNGYQPNKGFNKAPVVFAGDDQIVILPGAALLDAKVDDDGRGQNFCNVPGEWVKLSGRGVVEFQDSKKNKTQSKFSYAGDYRLGYIANDSENEAKDSLNIITFDMGITTGDHMGNNVNSGLGADAYISSDEPSKNFGSNNTLHVSNNAKIKNKIYLRFDIRQANGPITDVALKLPFQEKKGVSKREFHVFGLLEKNDYGKGKLKQDWNENLINWDNAPGNIDDNDDNYIPEKNVGGAVNNSNTIFLGKIIEDGSTIEKNILRNTKILNFVKHNKSKLVNFIITSAGSNAAQVASKDNFKAEQPRMYISYIDKNKAVDGKKMQGGYKVSAINVNPFTLESSFTLNVSYPQRVQITLHKENGQRIMHIYDNMLGHGKNHTIEFNASKLRSGKYLLRVKGEAFKFQKAVTILN